MINSTHEWTNLIAPFKTGAEFSVDSFIQKAEEIQSDWLELDEATFKAIGANCVSDTKLYWDEILPIALLLKTLNLDNQYTIQYAGHTKESPDAMLKRNGTIIFGIECVTANGYDEKNERGKWFETLNPRSTQWEIENKKLEQEEREKDPDGITFSRPTIPITKASGKYQRQSDRVLSAPEGSYEILKDRITSAFSNKKNMSYANDTKLLVAISRLASQLNISNGKYFEKLKQELVLPQRFSNVYIANVANPKIYEL